MKKKAVLFDLFGTITVYGDTDESWNSWFAAISRDLKELFGYRNDPLLERNCEGFFGKEVSFEESRKNGFTIFEQRISNLLADLELESRTGAVRILAENSVRAWGNTITLDEDFTALIEELGNYKTGLVSNFDHSPYVYELLDSHHIRNCFDVVAVSGDVGISKPDREIFLMALKEIGVEPGNAVFVGDSRVDVEGAMASRMTPVLIDRGGRDVREDYSRSADTLIRKQETDITIGSLKELGRLLADGLI